MRWLVLAMCACSVCACSPGAKVAPDASDATADAVVYSTCAGDPRATPESLAAKAAAYDARVLGLHVHPQMPWVLDVAIGPGVDPETATVNDVVAWRSGENDGLWSSLVLAAEAYRFAATHDPAARETLATLLHGEQLRMQITGVPGLFTRQLIPPGVAGLACPTDPAAYTPSPDKTSNVWVHAQGAFAGWCFLDNVSQDEYVGHMFALGAVAHLVDDPALRAIAVDLLDQIGKHLVANHMEFVDWDGRPTQWGKVHPDAPGGDSPGYLAVLGASFLATAADGTGDPDLAAAYAQLGYASYLDQIAVWPGGDNCTANWNDLSMLVASFHDVIASDPANRTTWQAGFASALVGMPKGILVEHNAWWDLLWAASTPDPAVVEDAACALREFPRSNHLVARMSTAATACSGRFGEPLAAAPFSIADRCAATYAWWGNPYSMQSCAADPTLVQNPAGYLLPYWMARYRGFIGPND